MTKNSFWSWLAPVMAVNPDTCSPPNRFAMTTKHGCAFVLSYARRRQVEKSLRFSKCELAFESPRVQGWHTRLKLLLIATLAYVFLLSSLDPIAESLKQWPCLTGAIEPESGAGKPRLRSTFFVWRLVDYG
ncbi:MAG: hypothetical protein WA996_19845 [Candidatus Promineifilaceae bacterium]